jgi:GIY-YIG catalytic domain
MFDKCLKFTQNYRLLAVGRTLDLSERYNQKFRKIVRQLTRSSRFTEEEYLDYRQIHYIYLLLHPFERECYVGMTTNPLNRYADHLNHKQNLYKENWIQRLKEDAFFPFMLLFCRLKLKHAETLRLERFIWLQAEQGGWKTMNRYPPKANTWKPEEERLLNRHPFTLTNNSLSYLRDNGFSLFERTAQQYVEYNILFEFEVSRWLERYPRIEPQPTID